MNWRFRGVRALAGVTAGLAVYAATQMWWLMVIAVICAGEAVNVIADLRRDA